MTADLTLVSDLARVVELTEEHRQEAVEFLAVRPVHTVVMSSFIADNGIVSKLNRGKFYGFRGADGLLEGVALIGHTTLVEARSDEALKALAFTAKGSGTAIHLIMSTGNHAEDFHAWMTNGSAEPRLTCVEALFEARFPMPIKQCGLNVTAADMSQLHEVAEAQAKIAFGESGRNPLETDRHGYLKRVGRRIEQGRVFTVFENGKLIFKADIIAETQKTIYLEGVYVDASLRGQGIGSSCLSQLTARLLKRVENICLLSNVRSRQAHRAFEAAGFQATDQTVTIFV